MLILSNVPTGLKNMNKRLSALGNYMVKTIKTEYINAINKSRDINVFPLKTVWLVVLFLGKPSYTSPYKKYQIIKISSFIKTLLYVLFLQTKQNTIIKQKNCKKKYEMGQIKEKC